MATLAQAPAGLGKAPASAAERRIIKSVITDYTVRGKGPAVFLTHGVGSRRSVWDRTVDHLAPHFQCIAYDLRGHGADAPPDLPIGLDEFVADLDALRRHLNVEKAHFVGHSLGGMIVPAYAHAHPAHVKSISLISTVAFRGDEARTAMTNFVARLDKGGVAAVVDTLLDRWFTDDFRTRNPEVIRSRRAQVLELPPYVYRETYKVYATAETGPFLAEIEAPALVMTGEFDPSCGPGPNRKMAEALPKGELSILPLEFLRAAEAQDGKAGIDMKSIPA